MPGRSSSIRPFQHGISCSQYTARYSFVREIEVCLQNEETRPASRMEPTHSGVGKKDITHIATAERPNGETFVVSVMYHVTQTGPVIPSCTLTACDIAISVLPTSPRKGLL